MFPEEDLWPASKFAIKRRIRSAVTQKQRSSNRNRHVSPSVNTSRLVITNRLGAPPDYFPFADKPSAITASAVTCYTGYNGTHE